MARPAKPAMSDVEYRDTLHMTVRGAAWAISEGRGAVTYPKRRVSEWWVRNQRRVCEETMAARKRDEAVHLPTGGPLRGNATTRDVPDPEPHQESDQR